MTTDWELWTQLKNLEQYFTNASVCERRHPVTGLPFISAVWRSIEGWEYWLVKNPARWKKENLRTDQRDGLAKPSLEWGTRSQRLAFSFTAYCWHFRIQGLLHRVPSHLVYQICSVILLFRCLPGLWQSFLHHPSHRLLAVGFGLCDDAISHPSTISCLLPPTDSVFPHSVHICKLKGPKRSSMAAWAP